jgi:hypothetical protein
MDVDFHHRGSFGPSLAPRCCLHTRKSRRSAPLYLVWSWLPKIRRVRPSWPAPSLADVAIARACDERDRWIVNPANLWTSGSLTVHLLEVCSQALRASSASALCAACVPPLPSFLTRTLNRVRRQSTGQHEATTSNTPAGSTVVVQAYHAPSKTCQERAR